MKKGLIALSIILAGAGLLLAAQINGYLDFFQIAAPSNPPTGQGRIYVDSGTKKLACLLPDGSSCAPSGGGGGIANGAGLLAARGSGSTTGDRYIATDSAISEYRWNGSSWDAFVEGMQVTVPQITDFATGVTGTNATRTIWKNQGGVQGGIVLTCTNSSPSSDSLCGQFRAVPATPYTATLKFVIDGVPGQSSENSWAGFSLRDSGSGKMLMWGIYYSSSQFLNHLRAGYWNSLTNFNSNVYDAGFYAVLPRGGWYQFIISDDGSLRKLYIQTDGQNPVLVDSRSDTDFLTPDQIGLLIAPYNNALQITAVDYTVTSP